MDMILGITLSLIIQNFTNDGKLLEDVCNVRSGRGPY